MCIIFEKVINFLFINKLPLSTRRVSVNFGHTTNKFVQIQIVLHKKNRLSILMNDLLISGARIIDTQSPHHQQIRHVLISHDRIRLVSESIPKGDYTIINAEGLCLSPGWFDLWGFCGEPGFEHKDTIATFGAAAAAGGFTEAAVLPNTQPPVQTKESVVFLQERSRAQLTEIHAIAALSHQLEGKDMTDMYDLHHAGAVAFSDGAQTVNDLSLLMKALQYAQPFNGLVMNLPDEPALTRYGSMHEGHQSTLLGLKGMPSEAEAIHLLKVLRLLEYTGGKLHVACVSTAEGVQLIRQAKAKGLQLTCHIAAHQLAFTDTDLADFDTFLKVKPPFRSPQDLAALLEGLADGTIDALASAHLPQDEENKKLEFDQAEFGALGLQTAFAAANTYKGSLPLAQLIEKLTVQPRRILGRPAVAVAEQQAANLTLFAPDQAWTVREADLLSVAKNSPFIGKQLTGKVKGVFHRGRYELF
jgi:dihydroorotase